MVGSDLLDTDISAVPGTLCAGISTVALSCMSRFSQIQSRTNNESNWTRPLTIVSDVMWNQSVKNITKQKKFHLQMDVHFEKKKW